MEVEADMREPKVVISKEKVILSVIMAVAIFSVGIGLASVLSDSKSYENNKNNVVDLNEGSTYEARDTVISEQPGTQEEVTTSSPKKDEEETESATQATEAASKEESEVSANVATDPLDAYSFGEDSELAWPVAGNVVMNYSMDSTVLHKTLGAYKTNPAMSISADIGTLIGAAASGIVQSVYYSDETGTTVAVAIGDGYVTTYGLLDNLRVKEGDAVNAGQVLGTVGAPTAYYTEEGPNVYFAVTKDGEPVDPSDFLAE